MFYEWLLIYFLIHLNYNGSFSCGPGRGIHRKFSNRDQIIDRRPLNRNEHSIVASGKFDKVNSSDPRLSPIWSTSIIFANSDYDSLSRLAMKPCKTSLLRLDELVHQYFKKRFKIKVIRGYIKEQGAGDSSLSLHLAGRAFDLDLTSYHKDIPLTLTDKERINNLRTFAGLAYYHAKFTYVRVYQKPGKEHIHVSCPAREPRGSRDHTRCFPADSFVRLKDGSKKLMKDVKQGDKVLTMNAEGNPIFSEISMIMHRQHETVIDDYVSLTTQNGENLILSSNHLIFTKENGAIFSKDVKIHDTLYTYNNKKKSFISSRVLSIRYFVIKTGAYAPLSMEGSIVVNDIYASCYALFPSHSVSHAVFSVWRWMYTYFHPIFYLEDSHTKEFHWYPNILRSVVNRLYILPYSV